MLKTTKNITLVGQSLIANAQVIYMNASISADGSTNANINTSITNQTVYEANKTECRKDISDFQTAVYAAQDEATTATSTTANTTTATSSTTTA